MGNITQHISRKTQPESRTGKSHENPLVIGTILFPTIKCRFTFVDRLKADSTKAVAAPKARRETRSSDATWFH